MERKIRTGKDFRLVWAILTNTEDIPLAGRDLRLDLIDPLGKVITLPIEIEGNKVISTVRGKDFLRLGVYRLTLWENYGQNAQTAVDCCEAFRLVSTTCQEGGEDPEGLDTETIDLGTSDMQVSFKGDKGDSAYEIAVKNGFKGTEEEWLASLKGDPFTYEDFTVEQIEELQRPALEAADSANNATTEANKAASKANTAAALAETKAQEAESAANTAAQTEATIQQAETSRVSAEKIREENEAVRIASETAREKAEQGRVSAEQERVSAESSRVSAEQTRVSSETQRGTEFTRLKGESETATNNANQAADKANQVAEGIEASLSKKQDNLVSGENIKTINGEDVLGKGNIVINPTIMDLKWTTNLVTTRKLVPAELRKKGVKIAYTVGINKTYIVEQYQIDEIDDNKWSTNANWKGCRTPMTPFFEAAGASFNEDTGYYELYNSIFDLTEYDMHVIYLSGLKNTLDLEYYYYDNNRIRANLKYMSDNIGIIRDAYLKYCCRQCSSLEVFYIINNRPEYPNRIRVKSFEGAFYSCGNLKKIIGILDLSDVTYSSLALSKCAKLEEVYLYGLNANMPIESSSLLKKECVLYMVQNALATSPITITLHPDVYNLSMSDPDIQAALAEKTNVSLATI